MIRPIDTQVIYSQSPSQSGKQHAMNQQPAVQQDQFAQIMHKEVENKKDTVYEVKEETKLDNDLEKQRDKKEKKEKKKEKSDKQAKSGPEKTKSSIISTETSSFDIRI